VRVCVLTTSYPRSPGEVAGAFIAEAVEQLRNRGVEVSVVSPADFAHFGIAYGDGIVQNLRRKPLLVFLLPLFAIGFARAARTGAADADVVHAHWIPSGLVALATRKPFVLQVWGTDVELARRVPWLVRPLIRRARIVVCASAFLAKAASGLGGRDVRVIANGVEIPAVVAPPQEPPHVLFVGRLAEEKGILEFLESTEGLDRVIVGDGPLRGRVPESIGFVPHDRIGQYYERAGVVCVPSRREGYGVAAREAMAWGRPVVATAVGGLPDAIRDGENGLLAPPGDVASLRSGIERLLTDSALRAKLGANARRTAEESYSWDRAVDSLLSVYAEASRRIT
jgi:glycosyltransferase involved in cell wall biosynthesis